MPLLPAHLPPWAYLGAGVAAFAAARVLTHGAGGAGTVDPAAAPAAATPKPADAGGLWDTYGDQVAQFGAGGSAGVLNGASTGFSTSDALGGQLVAPPPVNTPTPAAVAATYTLHIAAGARVVTYTVDAAGQITSAASSGAWRSATRAPASAMVRRHTAPTWPGSPSTQSTTRVLAGAYAGKIVQLANGVSLTSP